VVANIVNAREFGASVRAARKERGWSQEELVAQAGVSRAWLARFENGHPAASIDPISECSVPSVSASTCGNAR